VGLVVINGGSSERGLTRNWRREIGRKKNLYQSKNIKNDVEKFLLVIYDLYQLYLFDYDTHIKL